MGLAKFISLTFDEVQCCNCGVWFCLDSYTNKERLKTRKLFYCPNGHPQSYTGETEAEKLKKELELERSRRAWAEQGRDSATKKLKTTENKLKKIERRVSNGVCPCCNRSFVQLERHMKCKHPDFVEKP